MSLESLLLLYKTNNIVVVSWNKKKEITFQIITTIMDWNVKTTYPTKLRDFLEWHKGVEHFGFWVIEVKEPKCLEKIKRYKVIHRMKWLIKKLLKITLK